MMDLRMLLTKLSASFGFRLFVIFTLMTALMTMSFSAIYIFSGIRERRNQAEERAHLLASQLADDIRLALFAENQELLVGMATDTSRYPGVYGVKVLANDGRVMAEVHRSPAPSGSDLLSATAEVRSIALGLSPESAMTGVEEAPGARIGTVRVDLDLSREKEKIHQLIATACSAALLFWMGVSLLSYLVLRKLTSSFDTLVKGLETMRSGNYAISIAVERDDEAGRATAAVNQLAAALRHREEENVRLNEELMNAMRLEVQEEKKQLMAKLIQTNRMAFLGLLASSMAHEINNPNAAIGLAGLYLSRAWKDALPLLQQIAREEGDFCLGGVPFSVAGNELRESCATIERNTRLIASVVQDLRSYSLGKPNEFRPDVDLNQVVRNALSVIRANGHHMVSHITADFDVALPLVTASQHQLEQVMINLLLNALQSLKDSSGTVVVSTSHHAQLGLVTVTIRDEGKGIAAEHMERLLEPFFSTRIEQGGSGLGLFVANFLVTGHGGRISFSSQLGVGTTVTVSLPSASSVT